MIGRMERGRGDGGVGCLESGADESRGEEDMERKQSLQEIQTKATSMRETVHTLVLFKFAMMRIQKKRETCCTEAQLHKAGQHLNAEIRK